MKLKVKPFWVGWLVVYGATLWLSAQMITFGDARNRQEVALDGSRGMVLGGHVSARQAWGMGILGDVCLRVDADETWYCVQPQYYQGKLSTLYEMMTIGTPVFIKANRGQIAEMILGDSAVNRTPESPRLISYNASITEEYLATKGRGSRFIYFGIGLLVLIAGFHLFWIQKKRASGKPTDTPMLRV